MANHPNRSRRGAPQKAPGEHDRRINITLSPSALAILDARGRGRSQEIERLVLESEQVSPALE